VCPQRKENIVINIPDFGDDVESFEEFWSQVPDLFDLDLVQ